MDRLNSQKNPSWNPLDCSSSALPLPLALCAKLMVIYLLFTKEFLLFPEPFLPFVPFLDQIAPPAVLKNIFQFIFLVASFLLLFNRYARSAAFATGAVIFLSILSSKPYFSNSRFFFACFLMLIGLYKGTITFWFLRAQLVLVYFGAGFNKLLDPDWQSGQYIEFWANDILQLEWYRALSENMAPMLLAKIMSVLTIMTEIALAVSFAFPSITGFAITLGVIFHLSLLFFIKMKIADVFLYAMASAYLVFIKWPKTPMAMYYPDNLSWLASLLKKIDYSDRLTIHTADVLSVRTDEKEYKGFHAILPLLRYNPLTYVLLAGVFLLIF